MGERLFSTLIPKLSPHVPGCPQPLMVQVIRDAAIRICEKTLVWRYTQPTFALLPGVHEYFYSKPTATDVHVVFAALLDGEPMEKLTLEQAIELYPEWADLYNGIDPSQIWSNIQSSTFNSTQFNESQFNETLESTLSPTLGEGGSEPRSITQLTPDKFVVLPIPDDAKPYMLRMFYALKPKRSATGMDEAVFDDLEEAILHSALQYLCIMPNVAWSNRELAVYFGKLSLFQTTERRARANLTNMRGSVLVRIPRIT
jgi:hypothetical protein